jgi:acetyltransferase-like isoleucine patch superfamily enzyme
LCDIPESTVIEPLCVVYVGPGGRLKLGELNTIYPGVTIRIKDGWMETGKEVSFGPGCHIYEPRAGLRIGDYCMIGGGVLVCGVNHGVALGMPMRHQKAIASEIVIKDDVWIGMGCVITPGVLIGAGAIVSAGSVVIDDVPPMAVVGGVPAKVLKMR